MTTGGAAAAVTSAPDRSVSDSFPRGRGEMCTGDGDAWVLAELSSIRETVEALPKGMDEAAAGPVDDTAPWSRVRRRDLNISASSPLDRTSAMQSRSVAFIAGASSAVTGPDSRRCSRSESLDVADCRSAREAGDRPASEEPRPAADRCVSRASVISAYLVRLSPNEEHGAGWGEVKQCVGLGVLRLLLDIFER